MSTPTAQAAEVALNLVTLVLALLGLEMAGRRGQR
jgi:hypothetical protein